MVEEEIGFSTKRLRFALRGQSSFIDKVLDRRQKWQDIKNKEIQDSQPGEEEARARIRRRRGRRRVSRVRQLRNEREKRW